MKNKFLMLSPLTLGFIVAGCLLFVIVAVVRSATADTGKVEAVTAQQYAAFQAALAQQGSNSASAALPVFVLATETPEVYHPTLPMQVAQDPAWMSATIDGEGKRWVWAGDWYDCLLVATDAIGYAGDNYGDWVALGAIGQRDLQEACHGQ